jgi:hypothetical protein
MPDRDAGATSGAARDYLTNVAGQAASRIGKTGVTVTARETLTEVECTVTVIP